MPTIEEILKAAREANASDVHLAVGVPPKMRVNGRLITMEYQKMLPADTLDVVLHIMTETQRDCFEERGEYSMAFSIPDCGRYRVNAYKEKGCVALAFRLVGDTIPSLEELGVPDSVQNLYQRRKGLVLVSGPSGSGKTTTLAAMIEQVNSNREAHVITLEQPIEYLHQHKLSIVNQREIEADSACYGNALRAALREDADVILAGELRDSEAVSAAIEAAETGHLIYASLHTFGVANTIAYIVDGFLPHKQQQIRRRLSQVLETVISQQLIPTVDQKGRVAAYEVLHVNRAARDFIGEGKFQQLESVMESNHKAGMITMDEAICGLYCDGKIDRDTAVKYAMESEGMESRIERS